MFSVEVQNIAQNIKKKVSYMDRTPLGYLILSALAGVYVGFGVVLVFNLGGPFAVEGSAATKLVMGASFGVALTLVVFAGCELFTGNNMFGILGTLTGEISWSKFGKMLTLSLIGNLIGSVFLAYIVVKSGAVSADATQFLLQKVAGAKMNKPAMDLFLLGILCNWVVCLALWACAKTKNEAAKIFLIFWCLFAFIGSGFEHSIANQTLLSLALFSEHGELVSWAGFGWNQIWVIMGNFVGGAVFVGGVYWSASVAGELEEPTPVTSKVVTTEV